MAVQIQGDAGDFFFPLDFQPATTPPAMPILPAFHALSLVSFHALLSAGQTSNNASGAQLPPAFPFRCLFGFHTFFVSFVWRRHVPSG